MAERKSFPLTLSEGEPLRVRFTFASMDKLRDKSGIELEDFRDKDKMTRLITGNLSLFIWCCLLKKYRDTMTPDDIAENIDFVDLPRITGELMAAIGGDAPDVPTTAVRTTPANDSPSNGVEHSQDLNSDYAIANSGG
jgi:hypothetical protein